MRTINLPCEYCSGRGFVFQYDVVGRDDTTTTLKTREVPCKHCNGTGYSEHVLFSIEEAKIILEHCGLSTES